MNFVRSKGKKVRKISALFQGLSVCEGNDVFLGSECHFMKSLRQEQSRLSQLCNNHSLWNSPDRNSGGWFMFAFLLLDGSMTFFCEDEVGSFLELNPSQLQ